ncbi:MAG TPA: mechanosensitive ion channel [Smithellaceae bacterium]|jgi:small-conductance mechanosensitive channel|nr:mechanosensitive ion channel [Smithellaceae bacterium]HPL67883.1 mechanosensitive ion channel [Smithellaceae bacterium]HQG66709.1 mechanosensitive ion channel [Smithella sp.]
MIETQWKTFTAWLYDPTVGKIVAVIAGVLVITLMTRMVGTVLLARIDSIDTRYRLRKLVNAAGTLAAIILITVVFSNKLGNLTVAFGVAGAGIAFALQEVIASIAGWIAVSFGNFYSVGDRVQLGGITGDVIDIGVLRTTLMETGQWVKADLYNGRIVRVANSFVFKEPVFNYSGDFPFLWDEITVPVKYGSDYKLAREILQKIADDALGGIVPGAKKTWHEMVIKYRIEDARIEPIVTLIANDNWLEFTIRYVTDFKRRRLTKDILFTRIMEEFDATDGKVSLASATFHLVEAPVLNVRMTGNQ